MQGRLFNDPEPPTHTQHRRQNYHRHDPPASRLAASRSSHKRDANIQLVVELVRCNPGQTACELWDNASAEDRLKLFELQEIRRRLVDAEAEGLVVKSEHPRACTSRGTQQHVWHAKYTQAQQSQQAQTGDGDATRQADRG